MFRGGQFDMNIFLIDPFCQDMAVNLCALKFVIQLTCQFFISNNHMQQSYVIIPK